MLEQKNCPYRDKCLKKDACESEFCIKLFKLNSLWDNALMTDLQRKHVALRIDSDGTDKSEFLYLKDVEENISNFVTQGLNLYIYSENTGNGKTAWSLRLINAYFNTIWHKSDLTCRGLFIHVPRLLLELKDNITEKSSYIQHIKKNIIDADIVIWDEIGTKGLSSYEFENVLNMVNARIDNNKSNIYTSNLNPSELKECVGDRLYSRIVNLSKNIELRGMDKRGL